MAVAESTATPLMQQYHAIKSKFPDALVLFQVGDFYEFFYEDAQKAAAFLAITLTARGKNNGEPIPLCGVPVHACQHYISKLVKGGFKVVLCDQLEPAVQGKIVERGVTQVYTPATLTDSQLLDEKSSSFLFSFFPSQNSWGLLFGELLTSQLHATVLTEGNLKTLDAELGRFLPDEIIIPESAQSKPFETYFSKLGYYTSTINHQNFYHFDQWINNFNQDSKNYLTTNESLRSAFLTFYLYLKTNQEATLQQFTSINFYNPEDFLMLDASTQRNLELVKNMHDGSAKNTLFAHLDHAVTGMGSRTIKKWILRPLITQELIQARQNVIQKFIYEVARAQAIKKMLGSIGDLERVIGRILLRKASVIDYRSLCQALEIVPQIYEQLKSWHEPLLQKILQHCIHFDQLHILLTAALNNDVTKDWIIKSGFNQQLDHLRNLAENSNELLLKLEQKEQQKSGINSLKIRYNQMYGYYFEITKSNLSSVPDYFIKMQSLVGKDRFTTPELKAIEADIIHAQARVDHLQKELFESLKHEVAQYGSSLRKLGFALAHLDALFGLSQAAYHNGYIRPEFNDNNALIIKDGKHPIIATNLGHHFIANSTQLNNQESFWIITGPNMGGKSTYLRQVALITLMAQMGAFIPATHASLSLCDRIFTRIGSGDNVAQGKSTFLIEMEETALICLQATEKSLIILDEIGRGTSTFDGLALAQAVVEYLHTHIKARCLFATHYHELTLLSDTHPGIVCYYASSKKINDRILLLYKIEPGVADGSFGIEVAKLAELPTSIINRAQEILEILSSQESAHQDSLHYLKSDQKNGSHDSTVAENYVLKKKIEDLQNHILSTTPFIKTIQAIDLDELSPKKAFDIIWNIKKDIESFT